MPSSRPGSPERRRAGEGVDQVSSRTEGVAVKPQKAGKRRGRPVDEAEQPQFDHKTDRLSLLSGLLTDWFGEHIVDTGQSAVSSGRDRRFAGRDTRGAKGRP